MGMVGHGQRGKGNVTRRALPGFLKRARKHARGMTEGQNKLRCFSSNLSLSLSVFLISFTLLSFQSVLLLIIVRESNHIKAKRERRLLGCKELQKAMQVMVPLWMMKVNTKFKVHDTRGLMKKGREKNETKIATAVLEELG